MENMDKALPKWFSFNDVPEYSLFSWIICKIDICDLFPVEI